MIGENDGIINLWGAVIRQAIVDAAGKIDIHGNIQTDINSKSAHTFLFIESSELHKHLIYIMRQCNMDYDAMMTMCKRDYQAKKDSINQYVEKNRTNLKTNGWVAIQRIVKNKPVTLWSYFEPLPYDKFGDTKTPMPLQYAIWINNKIIKAGLGKVKQNDMSTLQYGLRKKR